MIRRIRFSTKAVLAIVVFIFLGISGIWADSAKEPDFKPIADEMIAAGGISWSPKVNYHQLVLTIARPDGSVFRKTFDSGDTPYVSLSSIFGESAENGSYTYELTLIPHIERRVRSSNDDTLVARTQDRRALPRKALTQSGAFTVKDGMIVTPGAGELESGTPGGGLVLNSTQQNGISRPQDQVILDDLIVDGSICVGFDCVNGESFGFDTLRLKENNLRIKFLDTSTSASFPSNDWQITANDSSNGGANKFSIDDITGGRTPFTIEASAPSHSLYVDDGGRVGFGTSTPVADLHVKSGNTPTLRLEQDGSSGFTPQTWDVSGNEANFFIRDATNGSTLPIRLRPGAPTSAIDIAGSGRIGLGTASPDYPVHLLTGSTTNAEILAERSGGAQAQMGAAASLAYFGARTDDEVRFQVNSDWRLRLNPTSNSKILEVRLGSGGGAYSDGTDWFPSSSREVKENINNLTEVEALRALSELTPVKYNYKINKKEERVGFIAEDVPELVAVNGKKHLNAMDIVAVLTKVVQQQQKTIAKLEKEMAELKKKLQSK